MLLSKYSTTAFSTHLIGWIYNYSSVHSLIDFTGLNRTKMFSCFFWFSSLLMLCRLKSLRQNAKVSQYLWKQSPKSRNLWTKTEREASIDGCTIIDNVFSSNKIWDFDYDFFFNRACVISVLFHFIIFEFTNNMMHIFHQSYVVIQLSHHKHLKVMSRFQLLIASVGISHLLKNKNKLKW